MKKKTYADEVKKKLKKEVTNFQDQKCWQCGKKTFTHKARVITATGLRELDLCDYCHMYWGGD